jgi:dsRNA-specific ribonuclease
MEGARKVFTIAVMLDDVQLVTGTGYTKKEASQDASQKALQKLGQE